jgi:hypothetical protein
MKYRFLIFDTHKKVLSILGLFGNYSDISFLRRTSKLKQPFLQTDQVTHPVFLEAYVAVDEGLPHLQPLSSLLWDTISYFNAMYFSLYFNPDIIYIYIYIYISFNDIQ